MSLLGSISRCTFAVVVGLAAPAAAVEPPLHLADVVTEALARNPEIQAARARATAAAAVPARVSAWDDPTLSWEAWNFPESFDVGKADNNIFKVAQKIPFPGKRTLTGTAAEHDARMVDADAAATALDVTAAVKRAYWDLWQEIEQQRIYDRDRALVDKLARVTSDRYAAGQGTQADVVRAEVERTHVDTRIATGALAVQSARAELEGLLSRDGSPLVGAPADVPLLVLPGDAPALVERALATRPELAAQAQAIAREEAALARARLDYLPDFELAFSRFVNVEGGDGFGAMASVSVPLAFKSKYDAGVAEATARLGAAQADRRRAADRVRREVEQAYLKAETALTRHGLFRDRHLPHAEQALAASETAYQSGGMSAADLFESVRAIETVQLEHVAAAADLERARADLERAVGEELPRAVGASHHTMSGKESAHE